MLLEFFAKLNYQNIFSLEAVVVYIFAAITLMAFLRLVIWGDTLEKTFQKIIGGISVMLVAILANHWLTTSLALFIGGLIIASEDFMKALAAILRTDSRTMPDTLDALNRPVDITAATKKDIKRSEEENRLQNRFIVPNDIKNVKILDSKQRIEIKKKILEIISDQYTDRFTQELKLENEYGSIVMDGVVHHSHDKSKLDLENVLGLLNIEIIPQRNRASNMESLYFIVRARRALEKIRYLFIKKAVLIIFAASNLSQKRAGEIEEILLERFSDKGINAVHFGFFNISESEEPELISMPPLRGNVIGSTV